MNVECFLLVFVTCCNDVHTEIEKKEARCNERTRISLHVLISMGHYLLRKLDVSSIVLNFLTI